MTQYNEQQRECGPGYVMVADVQGSKGRGRERERVCVCVASVVMGNGLMCVCVCAEGVGVMLNDLFIKFTNQKPVFVC